MRIFNSVKPKYILILLFLSTNLFSQRIGEIIPPNPPVNFPSKTSGISLTFSDNGFGLGFFFTAKFNRILTGITEISAGELKSEREIERYDYWGRPVVLNKVNRIFSLPLFLGLKYRLFANELADNLRPYIITEIGPALVVATNYNPDLFSSFSNPKYYKAFALSFGFGGNFGLSITNILGLSFKFRYIHILESNGVETLKSVYKKDFSDFALSLNIGWMFN